MTDYPATPAHAPFREATSDFEDLVKTLFEVGAGSADHAAIEQLIETRGTEVLRKLLEATLNERASSVKLAEVEGADAIRRTHHRSGQRVLESLFGSVLLWRDRVGARGATALVPADASLNLPLDHFSFGVRARVVSEVVRGSYDAAVAAIAVTTGADVAKRQAESLVISAAQDFDAFYKALERVPAAPGEDPGLLVISVDGKGIVMRPKGLREATRKAADKSAHKIPGRLSRGEKANRKRMATVAAIYDLKVQPRCVDDIVGDLRGEVRERRPRPQRKRIWASVEKSSREAIADVFDEACARDPQSLRPIVVLVDGAWTQIREIQAEAKRRGRAVTMVLDIIHVIEYLWAAAWNVFEEGDPRAKEWVGNHLRTILLQCSPKTTHLCSPKVVHPLHRHGQRRSGGPGEAGERRAPRTSRSAAKARRGWRDLADPRIRLIGSSLTVGGFRPLDVRPAEHLLTSGLPARVKKS